jgi:hypothetical protein
MSTVQETAAVEDVIKETSAIEAALIGDRVRELLGRCLTADAAVQIALLIALVATILTNRKVRQNFKLEFAAEGVAREMLIDRKWPYRTFRVLKYHLSGFADVKKNLGSSRWHSAHGRGTGGLGTSLAESRVPQR